MPLPPDVMHAASLGPLLEGVLIPLSNQGKLRVSYNWLYSALNCDPTDSSDFVWILSKVDDNHISLSPRDIYAGRRLYASVRDDLDWYVQLQAPYSADWITAAGGDERLSVSGGGQLTMSLTGFNGQYLAVNAEESRHDDHNGYRVQSIGSGSYSARTFFVGITQILQPAVTAPLRTELTGAAIGVALESAGLQADDTTISRLLAALR